MKRDDIITLVADGMCACVFKTSVLISHMVDINRHNPQKQKFMGAFNKFYEFKEVLRPKSLRIAAQGHACKNNGNEIA